MKKAFISLALLLLLVFASATTLCVALDGSQPYNRIQDAINAAVNGDIVLVHPGIYYENLLITGKNITLASLEYGTGDVSYKYTTIIDGNHNGSVIEIRNGITNSTVRGFTIRNGSGRYSEEFDISVGGALNILPFTTMNYINITNCIIRDNVATSHGGGIYASSCNLNLSGVSIFNNDGAHGGGLYHGTNVYQDYSLTFDPNNRCNIYSNRASNGSDISLDNHTNVHVVVDTFTVANPWNFYANNNYSYSGGIPNPFTFDILHTVHTEINADHYVAPWGDDDNDGLSPASPLKTLFKASYNIASDPDNPKTIHVANGYYSKTANQQIFPVSVKNYCRLIGESKEGVILDFQNKNSLLWPVKHGEDIAISNVTIVNMRAGLGATGGQNINFSDIHLNGNHNGKYFISLSKNKDISLTNITVQDGQGTGMFNGVFVGSHNGYARFKNIEISNLTSMRSLRGFEFHSNGNAQVDIDGLKIHGLSCTTADEYSYNSILQVSPVVNYPNHSLRIEIKNSAFYDNYQAKWNHMALLRALNDTTFVSNCTYADNRGGSYPLLVSSKSVLKNNIFWNPELNYEVGLGYFPESGTTTNAEFDNNCIRGGFSGIYNMSPINQIIWHDNNINLDPLFEGEGSHPYRLSAFSPLIDIGTEYDLPADALDAGGNERVWDGDGDGIARIDLGAYEYQPVYAPANFTLTVDDADVHLEWQMPDLQRALAGYRIYRNEEILVDIFELVQMQYTDRVPANGFYTYYVVALYGLVESAPTHSITIEVDSVSNEDIFETPGVLKLAISPNPFRDMAVITYQLDKNSEIELNIYNLKGQKVRSLQKGSQSKGEQILAWDGGDDAGRHTSAGVYFLQLKQDGKLVSRRKLLKY